MESAEEAAMAAPTKRRPRVQHKRKWKLASFHLAPDYLRDNEFIKAYYRHDLSPMETLGSLFRLHNETGNIWTHLAGFVLFLVLTVLTVYARPAPLVLGAQALRGLEQRIVGAGYTAVKDWLAGEGHVVQDLRHAGKGLAEAGGRGLEQLWHYGGGSLADLRSMLGRLEGRHAARAAGLLDAQWPAARWPVHVFTAGAMTCMLTSSVCHLLGCCQKHIIQMVWRFDYTGIVVLIVTSFVPPVYYGFLCEPGLRAFYLLSTATLGAVTAAVSLLPWFQGGRFRAFRAGLFTALGLWGIAPALHSWLLHGSAPAMRAAFGHDLAMGALYVLGAVLYATRVPERWRPGAFDLVLNSHQLFHLCVVAAAAVHYRGVLQLLQWRDSTGGCLAHAYPDTAAAWGDAATCNSTGL